MKTNNGTPKYKLTVNDMIEGEVTVFTNSIAHANRLVSNRLASIQDKYHHFTAMLEDVRTGDFRITGDYLAYKDNYGTKLEKRGK